MPRAQARSAPASITRPGILADDMLDQIGSQDVNLRCLCRLDGILRECDPPFGPEDA
jgi:hypothetical protein